MGQDLGASLGRLGFFHFVQGYDQPIPMLDAELRKYAPAEIAGSLIVLPETFNLGRYYWDEPAQGNQFLPIEPFLDQLTARSRQVGAVFIVSVLEGTAECRLPYNSAYIVTPDEGKAPILMSRKVDPRPALYQAGTEQVGENPLEYGGVCIAAVVCNDHCRLFGGRLAESISVSPTTRKVLCIPACMSPDSLDFIPALAPWPGKYAVLANSNPWGCGSFIKNKDGEKRPSFGARGINRENRIILHTWDELDSTDGRS